MLTLFGLLNLGFDESPTDDIETVTGQSFVVCRTITNVDLVQRIVCSEVSAALDLPTEDELQAKIDALGNLTETPDPISQIYTCENLVEFEVDVEELQEILQDKLEDWESLPTVPEPEEEEYVCPTAPEPSYDELRAKLMRRLALLEDL